MRSTTAVEGSLPRLSHCQPGKAFLLLHALNLFSKSPKPLASSLQKPLYAPHVHLCEVSGRPPSLNQLHSVLYRPAHHAQQRQRHHRRPVYSGSAVDKQLRPILFQGRQCEIHASPKYIAPLGSEIIVHRIPANGNPVRLRQRPVVELDLHVDDVRDSRARHRRHVLRVPNPAPNCDPVGHPRYIHPYPASSEANPVRSRDLESFVPEAFRRECIQQLAPARFHARRNRKRARPAHLSCTPALHSTVSSRRPPHVPPRSLR